MTTPRLLTASELTPHNTYVFWPKFPWETRRRFWSVSPERPLVQPDLQPLQGRRPFLLIDSYNPGIVGYGVVVSWLKVLDPDGGLGWVMVTDPGDKFAAATHDTISDGAQVCGEDSSGKPL